MEGTIEQVGQFYVLRLERRLNHPVEKVWAALTDPEQIQKWLAAARIDPRPGGEFVLDFDNTGHHMPGRVIKYEPPRLFEHTFGDDANGVVRWELLPDRDSCLLKLSHTVYSSAEMANFLSGWHTHLELFADLLDGNPRPWDWDRWRMHNDRYRDKVVTEVSQGGIVNETLRTIDGRPVLRIERWLNHPVEKVWRAITEPDQLGQWYPFLAKEMDLRIGGKILFDDDAGTQMEATIVELDPPRVFAFSEHAPEEMFRESDDLVHIELQPHEQSCLLIFTHTFDDRAGAASYATGWNACLDGLEMLLAGKPVEINVDWVTEHERYVDQFALNEGVSEVEEDGWTVRFERQLTQPVEATWEELTASAPDKEELSTGDSPPEGLTNQIGSTGPITEIDAPRVLEYEWLSNGHVAGRVRWELSQGTGHGARLILTQTGPSDLINAQAKAAEAWKVRIAEIARNLAANNQRKG